MSEPTAPAPVSEPTAPAEISPPGAAPTPPRLTATERTLTAALADGTLTLRDEPAEDGQLTFSTETKKKIFDTRTVTVVFLSEPGGEQLYRTTVDRGSAAIYNGEVIPTRPEDDAGIYTFDGWAYPDGTLADLSACEEDATVVPHFAVTPKFRVTFRLADGDITLTVLSGTAAVYPGDTPEKAPTADTLYTFDGWIFPDGTFADLSAVPSDLVVTPHFSEHVRTYTVTFRLADGTSVTRELAYGELPALPCEILPTRVGDNIRTYAGLSPTPAPVTEDTTYTVLYAYTPLFPLSDGAGAGVAYEDGILTVDATAASSLPLASLYAFFADARGLTVHFDGATLTFPYSALVLLREGTPDTLGISAARDTFRFFTEGGVPSGTLGATVTLYTGSSEENRRLSCENDGKTYLKFTSDGDFITFSAEAGVAYTYAAEYGINAVSDDFLTLIFSDGTFLPGEYVPLSYTLGTGYRLSSLTITDREGRSVAYDGAGFVMPSGGVDIIAVSKQITYRITFVAGGVAVKEYFVPYGTLPTPPPDPARAPDAYYTYTFVGWSEEITPAYADVTYEAVYERTPHPTKEENTFGGTLFRFFAKIFRAILDFFARLFGIE
ncbi:MAG TPA: hypothetical protein DDY70_02430 [Clostridiales bacterium]|nr:hypothetical protein [Clostridiales bacterium]